ncbi:MAG TPA: TIGR03619 family F420-dependent LLM class oxidoreductase [Ktedonobacteraceae bacterium]
MQIGISLPQMGQDASSAAITSIAQEAERLGFSSVWVGERLLRPRYFVPYGGGNVPIPDFQKIVYDPLETLTYVAAKTERIKLGTSVVSAFFHTPVVLARRFATLDQFSNGRVIAGIGQGWMRDEFETANVPFQRRGNGLEDYIGALHAVWGPDPVHYEGRFYHIVESDIGPKPVQPGGPPVLFGAASQVALKRAARLADGLNPVFRSWDTVEWIVHEFPEMVRRAGRDPQRLVTVARVNNGIHAQALPEPRPPLVGSFEQIHEDMQRLESLGITHVFYDLSTIPVHEQLKILEKLRRAADV